MTDEERNALVVQHQGIARQVACKFATADSEKWEDLVSVAVVQMLREAPKYDPERGAPSTYFYHVCRSAILNHLKVDGRHNVEGGSLDEELPGGQRLSEVVPDNTTDDPAATVEALETVDRVCLELTHQTRGVRVNIDDLKKADRRARDASRKWKSDLRAACFDSLKPTDMSEIMSAVVKKAKDGDVQATKLLLDYFTGGANGIVEEGD